MRLRSISHGDVDMNSGKCLSLSGLSQTLDAHNINVFYFSPGRFYASAVLKFFLAEILLAFDIRLEDGSLDRPKDMFVEAIRVPDVKGKVQLQHRNSYR